MKIMTISQYAKSRNISDKMIRKLISKGKIPAGKQGNKYLLNVEAVDSYFIELTSQIKRPAPVVFRKKKLSVEEMFNEAKARLLGATAVKGA